MAGQNNHNYKMSFQGYQLGWGYLVPHSTIFQLYIIASFEDIDSFLVQSENLNTKKKTNNDTKLFRSYQQRN